MATDSFYSSPAWLALRDRVIARDGARCTVAQLLGGACSGVLHVHHIEPRADRPDLELDEANCATACGGHHSRWEALRRALVRERQPYVCPHPHRSAEARRLCSEQRARQLGLVTA